MPSHPDATEAYRTIILRRDATEILLLPKGAGWTLPHIAIQKHQRVAEQLTKEIQNVWGLETCSLFVPSSRSPRRTGEVACAVLESVKQNQAPPAGTCWIPANVAADDSGTEDAATIRDALVEL